MDLIKQSDIDIIFDNLTKELRDLEKFTTFSHIEIPEVNGKKSPFIIWGSKDEKLDLRKFYVIDEGVINENFKKEFKNDHEIWSIIFEKISNNNKSLSSSIIKSKDHNYKYEYRHFSMPSNEINDQIVNMQFGSKVLLETDITNMYESIYTHAISWSVYGRDEYKRYYDNKRGYQETKKKIFIKFDDFDKKYRTKIRGDGESVGILTGQNMSDVLADFILSGIDSELISIKEFKNKKFDFFHWKDNYQFFFYTHKTEEIYEIVKIIKEVFNNFKLNIKFNINSEKGLNYKAKVDEIDISDINEMISLNNHIIMEKGEFTFNYNPYTGEELFNDDDLAEFDEFYHRVKSKETEDINEFVKSNWDKVRAEQVFDSSFCNSPEAEKKRKVFLSKWRANPKLLLRNIENLRNYSYYMKEEEIIHFERWINELNDMKYEYESLIMLEIFKHKFESEVLSQLRNGNRLFNEGIVIEKAKDFFSKYI